MNYYKDNVLSTIHIIPKIPFLLIILIISLFVIGFYLLKIELYDSYTTYAIKYKENDYLELIAPLNEDVEISKYEFLEYDNKKINIENIEIYPPETEQLYNASYNILKISLNTYDDMPSDIIFKVKLLKNKQSIFKKIFAVK